MDEPRVHISGFRMDFGDTTVIRDLSFDVHAGETFGFLGSNGSGKTTTIRALLGIYEPTAGILHINGRAFKPEHGDRLGYLPEERGLYKKEKVIDIMTYFGRLKGVEKRAARRWSLEYLERVALADKAGVPAGQALQRPAAEGPARRHHHEPPRAAHPGRADQGLRPGQPAPADRHHRRAENRPAPRW